MIYIDAEQLQEGLYNIKDGKIYKYKAKGGTVRAYKLEQCVRCEDCKYWKPWWCSIFNYHMHGEDFCSYGERKGQ